MPELPLPKNLHEEPTDSIANLDQGNENGNPPDAEVPGAPFVPNVADLQTSLEFIDALKAATLDNGGLDEDVLEHLRNPLTEPADASDPDFRLSLDLFLSTTNASEETYNKARAGVLHRHLCCEYTDIFPFFSLLSIVSITFLIYFRSIY